MPDANPLIRTMAERVRDFDWSTTPLGPQDRWPQSLRTAVSICLNSRFPMFVWWGPELINIYNDSYGPILGKRHPDALGRSAPKIWHEIWDVVGPQADAVMYRGEATWNERVLLVMERQGYTEDTWFTWSYSPIHDESGGVGGVFCACVEETGYVKADAEREKLLAALAAERRNLAGIIEKAPAFICTLRGPTHVVELANQRYYEIVGQRDIVGKPIREALPEVVEQGFPELLDRVYESGIPFTAHELPVLLQRHGDAPLDQRYMNLTYQPLRDPDGSVSGIFVHGVDVTEFVHVREARRESEQRLRLTANAIPALVAYVDAAQYYRFANAAYLQWFGVEPENVVGRSIRDVAGKAVYDERQPHIHRALAGETVTFECPMPHAGRGIRDTETTYVPDLADDGTVRGFVVLVYDITARKEAERERERLLDAERSARSDAERASRMKDEFLATLSHELRTPLNAIFGWSQILTRTDRSPAEVSEGLKVIERNARAQTQIIEDLLEMSRIISGKVRLTVEPLDLPTIVQAAVDTVRPAADAKGVHLSVLLARHDGTITGDAGRLQQVFWNLLSNAVKFTPGGGVVRVRMEHVDGQVEISVTDTGEGIRPEFLPHVFDRFRQADASTTRRHGGLGLGLAIVKQLVELHGGTVRVRSDGPTRGSVFTVTLPVGAARSRPESDSTGRPNGSDVPVAAPRKAPQVTGIRVVVVDDEPDARSMILRLLENSGAVVRAAATAAEAVQLLAEETPDVLVSDIGMPKEDGYSLIRRLRALPPGQGGQVPAVALTAYARTEDRARVLQAGYQAHVIKPVEPAELLTAIAALAGHREPAANS